MPTLVWIRRRRSGTSGAGAGGGVSASVAAAAAPDPAVSASSAAVQVALPVVSSKRKATCSGNQTNRKRNRANAATTAKKKSKTTSGRDLPKGFTKLKHGKFQSEIRWRDKKRYIGTYDTPEQASAAYLSVKKDLDDANISTVGAVDVIFDAAKKKAQRSFGGFVPEKRDLPRGVRKLKSGKFKSAIGWGNKYHHIGTFDSPEQASAAYVSVRKDLDDASVSTAGGGKRKKRKTNSRAKASTTAKRRSKAATSERDLPRGIRKTPSGKYQSEIWWDGKTRYIGTFDTPEQASAAFMSARKDLDDSHLSALGADEVKTAFDAAKKKSLEAIHATRRMDNHI